METESAESTGGKKKLSSLKVAAGIITALVIIGLIVALLWCHGVFEKDPEGVVSTTGTVVEPCKEGVKNCIKIKYTVLEEDKENGGARGTNEIEENVTEMRKDLVGTYKSGDELTVVYWKSDPTFVYRFEKKKKEKET